MLVSAASVLGAGRTSTLRKDHRQDIAKGRQCHKHRNDLLSLLAKHVPKERSSDHSAGIKHLLLWDCCEIGDVGERV